MTGTGAISRGLCSRSGPARKGQNRPAACRCGTPSAKEHRLGGSSLQPPAKSSRTAPPRLEDFPMRVSDLVRYADLDRQGHVNNAIYSTYFETGRVAVIFDKEQGLQVPGCTTVLAR